MVTAGAARYGRHVPNVETWNAGELVQVDAAQVLVPIGPDRLALFRIFEHWGMRWSVPVPFSPVMLLPAGLYHVREGGRVVCLSREGVAAVQV